MVNGTLFFWLLISAPFLGFVIFLCFIAYLKKQSRIERDFFRELENERKHKL